MIQNPLPTILNDCVGDVAENSSFQVLGVYTKASKVRAVVRIVLDNVLDSYRLS